MGYSRSTGRAGSGWRAKGLGKRNYKMSRFKKRLPNRLAKLKKAV